MCFSENRLDANGQTSTYLVQKHRGEGSAAIMMHIAIVEDFVFDQKHLIDLIQKNFEEHGEMADFTCYESGEAFLKAFRPGLFNAVFMDIMLAKNGLNGIETAEKLRTVAARIPLIFVSNERDYSLEGYLSHPALWLRSALSGRNYWCKRVWQIFKEETLFTDGRYHSEAG